MLLKWRPQNVFSANILFEIPSQKLKINEQIMALHNKES